jgi:hypothetical protein
MSRSDELFCRVQDAVGVGMAQPSVAPGADDGRRLEESGYS